VRAKERPSPSGEKEDRFSLGGKRGGGKEDLTHLPESIQERGSGKCRRARRAGRKKEKGEISSYSSRKEEKGEKRGADFFRCIGSREGLTSYISKWEGGNILHCGKEGKEEDPIPDRSRKKRVNRSPERRKKSLLSYARRKKSGFSSSSSSQKGPCPLPFPAEKVKEGRASLLCEEGGKRG